MDWRKFLLSFDGRIGRKAFWLFTVALIVVFGIIGGVMGAIIGGTASVDPNTGQVALPGMPIWLILLYLVALWPALAVQAKRWHDQDKSAWWILIGLIPFIGGLISLIMCGFIVGTPGPNRFGERPMA